MTKLLSSFSLVVFLVSCHGDEPDEIPRLDFRQEMRDFVQNISSYAKTSNTNFLIIPQNGQEILTGDGTATGMLATSYLQAIDGVGREDLFYGYTADDKATPSADRDFLISLCDVARDNDKIVMTTDYCSTQSKMDDSYTQNKNKGYVSFAADHRELDNVPAYPLTIQGENADNITSLNQVKNFLYLINPTTDTFTSKQSFLDALKATNYDLVLIDLFFDETALTAADITPLKTKANKASRLVICYMSIGEAEKYRFYWSDLDKNLIYKANPDWPGNYVVKYWDPLWQSVIYGNDQSYTKKILDAGFDGVYLDIIEAYESYE